MQVVYPGRIEIWKMLVFVEETRRNNSPCKAKTNNKRNPHMIPGRNGTWATCMIFVLPHESNFYWYLPHTPVVKISIKHSSLHSVVSNVLRRISDGCCRWLWRRIHSHLSRAGRISASWSHETIRHWRSGRYQLPERGRSRLWMIAFLSFNFCRNSNNSLEISTAIQFIISYNRFMKPS